MESQTPNLPPSSGSSPNYRSSTSDIVLSSGRRHTMAPKSAFGIPQIVFPRAGNKIVSHVPVVIVERNSVDGHIIWLPFVCPEPVSS